MYGKNVCHIMLYKNKLCKPFAHFIIYYKRALSWILTESPPHPGPRITLISATPWKLSIPFYYIIQFIECIMMLKKLISSFFRESCLCEYERNWGKNTVCPPDLSENSPSCFCMYCGKRTYCIYFLHLHVLHFTQMRIKISKKNHLEERYNLHFKWLKFKYFFFVIVGK